MKLLTLLVAAVLAMSFNTLGNAAEVLSADAAAKRAAEGSIFLVDIRRPEEWRESGVAASSATISMHEEGLLQKLARLTKGDTSKPIALICRTGARSTWLAGELEKRGYTNILNVREGMFGSQAGPGWLKRGLPVRQVQ